MIGREAHRFAIQIALVSLLSYVCGEAITGYLHGASARTGGMWAVMSAIVVLQQTRGKPVLSAALRFAEACIGTVIAALAILVWPAPAPHRPMS